MIITGHGLEPWGQEEAGGWTVRGYQKRVFSVLLRARRATATLEHIGCVRSGTPALCPQQCLPRGQSGSVCLFLNRVVKFVAYLT